MKKVYFLTMILSLTFLPGCTFYIPAVDNHEICEIKGNINTQGDKIYHLKECFKYNEININPNKGERWFCSIENAEKEGWVKSKNCPE